MLTIRLLGDIAVLRGEEFLALPPSKKTRALLAYLAVVGRPQRRERLCTQFWEVPDDPRAALRWSFAIQNSRLWVFKLLRKDSRPFSCRIRACQ